MNRILEASAFVPNKINAINSSLITIALNRIVDPERKCSMGFQYMTIKATFPAQTHLIRTWLEIGAQSGGKPNRVFIHWLAVAGTQR